MYISKKTTTTNTKPKTLHNLLSIIQFTTPAPKGCSIIYDKFFEILSKIVSIQMKIIENTGHDKSMPKYKKYLEGKINDFLHSIRPINPLDKIKLADSQSKTFGNKTPMYTMKRDTSLNQSMMTSTKSRIRKLIEAKDIKMNHSTSSFECINLKPCGFPSSANRPKSNKKPSFEQFTDENNKNTSTMNYDTEDIAFKSIEHYSLIPPSHTKKPSISSNNITQKTKSIMRPKDENEKKHSVTFIDSNNDTRNNSINK